ncbi:MAG: DsrE family protein [Fimbriimonadales bacterium]
MEAESSLVFIVTRGKEDPERATLPFVLGNGSLAMDVRPVFVLQSEGVRLATKGYADEIHAPGLDPLKKLMDNVLEAGCTLLVCSPCAKERGITEADLVPGAFIAGAAKVIELLLEAKNCLTY